MIVRMSDTQRIRLLGAGISMVVEVPAGIETFEHEGRLFQRTGFGHSVGADEAIPSFQLVEEE